MSHHQTRCKKCNDHQTIHICHIIKRVEWPATITRQSKRKDRKKTTHIHMSHHHTHMSHHHTHVTSPDNQNARIGRKQRSPDTCFMRCLEMFVGMCSHRWRSPYAGPLTRQHAPTWLNNCVRWEVEWQEECLEGGRNTHMSHHHTHICHIIIHICLEGRNVRAQERERERERERKRGWSRESEPLWCMCVLMLA